MKERNILKGADFTFLHCQSEQLKEKSLSVILKLPCENDLKGEGAVTSKTKNIQIMLIWVSKDTSGITNLASKFKFFH